MFNRLLLITFFSAVFFFSCKKDPSLIPTPVIQEQTSPFILQNDIYPNPCQGTFTIKTNTADSQAVSLYDLRGLQILNLTINGTTAIVDNSLVNGIYYLRISSKYGTNTNKIIVSK